MPRVQPKRLSARMRAAGDDSNAGSNSGMAIGAPGGPTTFPAPPYHQHQSRPHDAVGGGNNSSSSSSSAAGRVGSGGGGQQVRPASTIDLSSDPPPKRQANGDSGVGNTSSQSSSTGGQGTERGTCSELLPDTKSAWSQLTEAAEQLAPDVHLVANDGSRLPAHRLVLSARSPFFLKMFSAGMGEQNTGIVNFPDVEPDRLTAIVSWMYGRKTMLDLAAPSVVFPLLELAKRWEIGELCDQLSNCEACNLTPDSVLTIWDLAQKFCLQKLEARCADFVMTEIKDLFKGNKSANGADPVPLPAPIKDLAVAQVVSLLASDELPVTNEEEAMEVAFGYVHEHFESLSFDEVNEILLQLRWRLIPGQVIASRAMFDLALKDPEGSGIRMELMPALSDAMQFQLLGGQAWTKMPSSAASTLRSHHRIPIRAFSELATGMMVRVVDDMDHLRHLCRRCAPGAKIKVEWVAEMKSIVGATCKVQDLRDEIAGVLLEDPVDSVKRYLPFDALYLA
mmetsp:Transcript_20562/g.43870  ORF Transcript_20562/g.43870 Transcript_20562/m.43870 type:complete len:508 (-) Transcript_20562:151-1674(-)|eukprot:CAMPEP_0206571254 /NCGR_PEP_ID=MMETSP0325_2-20121206/27535_1 /ASSEMBLY_ACC=CAM_ASM_000347 /TAXON_ID=2866 /ORGANISM="Crypthecodinium cohnii, Strain Seligo" /LENGTH=507 /DNA_ID=CAMNT_0054075221 /DNA_START=103 /DNA_END=1626 /DNA_ORIENTATION=+